MTAHPNLRPAGRYEWEQIVRRARLTGLIAGTGRTGKDGRRPTRGGITAITFKAVALAYASYADDKGAEIWPGDATIAVDLECSLKTVKAVKGRLIGLGLLKKVRGRHRDRGEEYQLTLPVDLLDLLDVPTPAQHRLAAQRVRDAARGKPPGGSAGSPRGEIGIDASGGPPVPPNGLDPEDLGGSAGPAENGSGGSAGPALGGPPDPHTDHYRTRRTTDHSGEDLRTAVTGPRARDAAQDQTFPGRERTPDAPTDAECPRHHVPQWPRADGQPPCVLCRRGAPPAAQPDTAPPRPSQGADVA